MNYKKIKQLTPEQNIKAMRNFFIKAATLFLVISGCIYVGGYLFLMVLKKIDSYV